MKSFSGQICSASTTACTGHELLRPAHAISKGLIVLSVVWFLFAAITLASAVVDVASYRIPNALVLLLMVLFFIVAALHWREVDWLSHLGALALVLGAGVFFYSFGQMGAGDVKLLAALALWAGVYALIPLLFWVSLCGLLAMLVILLLRRALPVLQARGAMSAGPLPRVLRRGEGVPYGIGIAPGALVASLSFPMWLWQL